MFKEDNNIKKQNYSQKKLPMVKFYYSKTLVWRDSLLPRVKRIRKNPLINTELKKK